MILAKAVHDINVSAECLELMIVQSNIESSVWDRWEKFSPCITCLARLEVRL